MTIDTLVRDQTPVVALVTLLDGTVRQRVGIVAGYDENVMRFFDVNRDPITNAMKGFRSTPVSHVVRLEPIPPQHPAYRIVRLAIAAAYKEVQQ